MVERSDAEIDELVAKSIERESSQRMAELVSDLDNLERITPLNKRGSTKPVGIELVKTVLTRPHRILENAVSRGKLTARNILLIGGLNGSGKTELASRISELSTLYFSDHGNISQEALDLLVTQKIDVVNTVNMDKPRDRILKAYPNNPLLVEPGTEKFTALGSMLLTSEFWKDATAAVDNSLNTIVEGPVTPFDPSNPFGKSQSLSVFKALTNRHEGHTTYLGLVGTAVNRVLAVLTRTLMDGQPPQIQDSVGYIVQGNKSLPKYSDRDRSKAAQGANIERSFWADSLVVGMLDSLLQKPLYRTPDTAQIADALRKVDQTQLLERIDRMMGEFLPLFDLFHLRELAPLVDSSIRMQILYGPLLEDLNASQIGADNTILALNPLAG